MIRITCTTCKTVLTIDDAFAGGVCRCQHCGTIQTVPAQQKTSKTRSASSTTDAGQTAPNKALFQHKSRADAGTGLEQLAEVVASSGLSGSGLTGGHLRKSSQSDSSGTRLDANRLKLLLLAAGIVIAILLLIVIWLVFRENPPVSSVQKPLSEDISQTIVHKPAITQIATFAGIPLKGQTIVFVLDRDSGAQAGFSAMKTACINAIRSLGEQRNFQVIFWNNGSDLAYPSDEPVNASRQNIESCRKALADLPALGQTTVDSALTKAFAATSQTIVLVTSKTSELDDQFAKTVQQMRGANPAVIHTVCIGQVGNSTALQTIAAKTGGIFKEVSPADLQN